eukprot:3333118-Rhodomonas_salina.1
MVGEGEAAGNSTGNNTAPNTTQSNTTAGSATDSDSEADGPGEASEEEEETAWSWKSMNGMWRRGLTGAGEVVGICDSGEEACSPCPVPRVPWTGLCAVHGLSAAFRELSSAFRELPALHSRD